MYRNRIWFAYWLTLAAFYEKRLRLVQSAETHPNLKTQLRLWEKLIPKSDAASRDTTLSPRQLK